MRHAPISHTIVGIWATPPSGPPAFDTAVLANLFGDPYTTDVGLSQDGSIVVNKRGKPPSPIAHFGPQRFQVLHVTIAETVKAFAILRREAYARMNQQVPLLGVVGLNTEHEWFQPTFKPAPRWLAQRYIRKGMHEAPIDAEIVAQSIQFGVTLKDPDRRFNITLQPRADKEDGVFAAINDHREWNAAVPTPERVAELLEESVADVKNRLTPLLLGGIAENA